MTRPLLLHGVLLALLVSLGGCFAAAAPKLEVVAAEPGEITPEGAVVRLTLAATNESRDPLPLKEVHYSVTLEGAAGERFSFSGYRFPEATLRAGGTQKIVVPAVFVLPPGRPAPSGVLNYRMIGTLYYIAPGPFAETLYDLGLSVPKAGFSGGGQVMLTAAPTPTPDVK